MTFWLVQALNGISYGMLLFLLASGLSLIFGVMKILNLTHGSFYLLGGYLGLVVLQETGSFILAVLGASLAVALIGVVIERVFSETIPSSTTAAGPRYLWLPFYIFRYCNGDLGCQSANNAAP